MDQILFKCKLISVFLFAFDDRKPSSLERVAAMSFRSWNLCKWIFCVLWISQEKLSSSMASESTTKCVLSQSLFILQTFKHKFLTSKWFREGNGNEVFSDNFCCCFSTQLWCKVLCEQKAASEKFSSFFVPLWWVLLCLMLFNVLWKVEKRNWLTFSWFLCWILTLNLDLSSSDFVSFKCRLVRLLLWIAQLWFLFLFYRTNWTRQLAAFRRSIADLFHKFSQCFPISFCWSSFLFKLWLISKRLLRFAGELPSIVFIFIAPQSESMLMTHWQWKVSFKKKLNKNLISESFDLRQQKRSMWFNPSKSSRHRRRLARKVLASIIKFHG